MARVLFISLFLLFLPFIFYGGYFGIVRRQDSEAIWRDAPLVGLAIGGVVLAVAGLMGLVYLTGM